MANYTNFYETLKEANMRLKGTIVLYDGVPYLVHVVTNHKADNIFRLYLEKISSSMPSRINLSLPCYNIPYDDNSCGVEMDKIVEKYPQHIIRKYGNSPLFNKFRPFPLGFMNNSTGAVYVERNPARKSEQGLNASFCTSTPVSLDPRANIPNRTNSFFTDAAADMMMGKYPSFTEVLEKLRDPDIANNSVAFNRNMAIVRGPVGSLFLAYKSDVVGIIPEGTKVVLAKKFKHLLELLNESNNFSSVTVME